MGRAPCCDKANVKKGPWSPEEDATLKSYIEQHGTGGNWIALPQKIGLKRCGKSCRLRWLNYLRPNIKHGGFSEEEDNIICNLYISIGSRWSIIAAQLPGRTDNDIKNYWNTRLKKKLLGKQRKEQQQQARKNGNHQKRETMKKGRENFLISSNNMIRPNYNENPYNSRPRPNHHQLHVLPPIPYSNEEPRVLNDHTSIRMLLMKLGGRFSDDDNLPPENGSTTTLENVECNSSLVPPQMYQPQLNVQPCPPTNVHVLNTTTTTNYSTLPDTQYSTVVDTTTTTAYGFASELEQIIYSNPQKLEGLEFLYGDIMMMNNGRNNGSSSGGGVSSDWGEMSSSVVFPLVANNFQGLEQGMNIQEYAITDDHISYPAVS